MAETVIDKLRAALVHHQEWPTSKTAAHVVYEAAKLVAAIDQQAEMIEHYRAHVTPDEEAVRKILGDITAGQGLHPERGR